MHIHQNVTPAYLTTALCFAQCPLRGSGHFQSSSVTFRSEASPRTIGMAEAAASAQGESVCQCNVRIGL